MILTRKSHNCAGIAFIQGDSAGGSKLIEQTLHLSVYILKSDSKFSALNQKNGCCFSAMNRTLSLRYCFEALVECNFILEVLWSKSLLASNPKGPKNWTFLLGNRNLSRFEI